VGHLDLQGAREGEDPGVCNSRGKVKNGQSIDTATYIQRRNQRQNYKKIFTGWKIESKNITVKVQMSVVFD
jgi:hypothetical protein